MSGAERTISIVITNFNYAQFLPRAIDSAIGQSYPAVEVVVVDDASTDESREVIARYGDRIKPILLAANGGNAVAFAAGLAASRGEIVLFLDSDDALYPNAASAVAAVWSEGTAKVQFYLDAVDADEQPLGFRVPNIPFSRSAEKTLLTTYGYYPSPPTSGNAFARAVLDKIMPVSQRSWTMGIDGLLNALAALEGPVISLHHAFGLYRHHDRNHSDASGSTIGKIRRDLLNEITRENAIRAAARRLGRAFDRPLSLRIPGHCKGRLVSLRLDPIGHPFPDDHCWHLAARGIAASWRFPHHSLIKRSWATLGFLALAILPRPLLQNHLDPIMMSRKRPRILRHLCP